LRYGLLIIVSGTAKNNHQFNGTAMQIVLNPDATKRAELRDLYNRALGEAEELYIASAYLTDWDTNYKLGLGCRRVVSSSALIRADTEGCHAECSALDSKAHFILVLGCPIKNCGFHPKSWRGKPARKNTIA